jgi:hypothetical protein
MGISKNFAKKIRDYAGREQNSAWRYYSRSNVWEHTVLRDELLKGLSHEIYFKNFDKNLHNLAYLRDAAGFCIFYGLL